MEQKTKSFVWGATAATMVIVITIIGIITWLYFKGTAIQAEKSAQHEKELGEQIHQFGAVCSNAIPDVMSYYFTTLVPALNALQQESFNLEKLPDLTQGIKNKEVFLRHCGTQVELARDENTLKLSRRLVSASMELSSIYAYLHGVEYGNQINNCNQACQLDLVRRANEASVKLETILRGDRES